MQNKRTMYYGFVAYSRRGGQLSRESVSSPSVECRRFTTLLGQTPVAPSLTFSF